MHLGDEAPLGMRPMETPDEIAEDQGIEIRVIGDPHLYFLNGEGPWRPE